MLVPLLIRYIVMTPVISLRTVSYTHLLFMQSFMILLSVVIGGMNNVTGVVLGAAIIIILPELDVYKRQAKRQSQG